MNFHKMGFVFVSYLKTSLTSSSWKLGQQLKIKSQVYNSKGKYKDRAIL